MKMKLRVTLCCISIYWFDMWFFQHFNLQYDNLANNKNLVAAPSTDDEIDSIAAQIVKTTPARHTQLHIDKVWVCVNSLDLTFTLT